MKRFDEGCKWMMVFVLVRAFFIMQGSPPRATRIVDSGAGASVVLGLLGIGALWASIRIFGAVVASVRRRWMQLLVGSSTKAVPCRDIRRNIRGTYVYQPYLPEPDDLIVQLCHESKWLLVSREHDCYVVRSGDPATQRYLSVRWKPGDSDVRFWCWFPVRFSLEKEAPGLNARLMMRSRDLRYAAWRMDIGGSREACFYVFAAVPASSLSGGRFGFICQEITWEINDFHGELLSKFQYSIGEVIVDARHSVQGDFKRGEPARLD